MEGALVEEWERGQTPELPRRGVREADSMVANRSMRYGVNGDGWQIFIGGESQQDRTETVS